jgi:hypothetical protein
MRLMVSQPAGPKIRANRQEHERRDFIRIQNALSGSFSFMKRPNINNIYLKCYYLKERGSPGGSPYPSLTERSFGKLADRCAQ